MGAARPLTLLRSCVGGLPVPAGKVRDCARRIRVHLTLTRKSASVTSTEPQLRTGSGEEDLVLVRRTLDGDARATEELLARIECLPVMVRIKHRRMGRPLQAAELDDVVQSALLALWRKLPAFDGRARLEQWAYGFAAVEVVKVVERRARRARELPNGEDPDIAVDAREPPLDVERLAAALGRLEREDEAIVRARHFEELAFEEIAARAGRPVNTVKTRYYRSLQRLRGWLAGEAEA